MDIYQLDYTGIGELYPRRGVVPAKKYRIELTTEEQQELKALVSKGRAAAYNQTHARILLLSDEVRKDGGLTDEEVTRSLEIASATVERVKDGEGLRQTSLKFISDFANWDNAAKAANLETGLGPARAAPPGGDTAGGGPLRQRSQPGTNERPHDDRGAEPEEASVSSEAVLPEECNGDRNKHDHVE